MKKLIKRLKKCHIKLFTNIQKSFKTYLKEMKKIMFIIPIAFAIMASACNVTRNVTTESKYYQSGDTTTTIVTKTIESYNAVKNK